MKLVLTLIVLSLSMQVQIIFDFNKKSDIQDWIIVNDVVMGGRSSSTFSLDKDGLGAFKGNIGSKKTQPPPGLPTLLETIIQVFFRAMVQSHYSGSLFKREMLCTFCFLAICTKNLGSDGG